MGRLRARTAGAAVAIAAGLVLTLRGQVDQSRLQILQNVGLPAIDEGLLQEESHTPSSAETRRRRAVRAALAVQDRIGPSGTRYRSDRVIVRFRDEAAMAERHEAVR